MINKSKTMRRSVFITDRSPPIFEGKREREVIEQESNGSHSSHGHLPNLSKNLK
jgi:hypothetical protein